MRAGGADTFEALTSWRGVCALAVALFHFPIVALTRPIGLIAHAYLFVDFFFVLSGFVIASAYEDRLGTPAERRSFAIRRFGRLWPLHVSVLFALVMIALARGQVGADEKHSVFAIFTNLALVHGLGVHHDLTWNGPSWSISVEAALYALFVMVPRRVPVYVGFVLLGLVALSQWAPHGMASTFDFGIFRGFAGFFTGALISRLPRRDLGLAGELATLTAVAAFVSLGWGTIMSPLVFGAAVYVFAGSRGPVTRMLEARSPVALGEWSYSVYMVHGLVGAALFALARPLGLHPAPGHVLTGPPLVSLAILAAYVIAIVGLSALTYNLIERPTRDLFKRLAGKSSHPHRETTLAQA